jgi:hypothetical protein
LNEISGILQLAGETVEQVVPPRNFDQKAILLKGKTAPDFV